MGGVRMSLVSCVPLFIIITSNGYSSDRYVPKGTSSPGKQSVSAPYSIPDYFSEHRCLPIYTDGPDKTWECHKDSLRRFPSRRSQSRHNGLFRH